MHITLLFNSLLQIQTYARFKNFLNYPFGGYHRLIDELAKKEIFDIDLFKKVKFYNIDKGNGYTNTYGHLQSLKRYGGVSSPLPRIHVQHGMFECNHESTVHGKYLDKIIVMNHFMKESILLKNPNLNIFCVGPFIHYANQLYSNEKLSHLKNKFGKTLLVYLPHSITRKFKKDRCIDEFFDLDKVIRFLNKYKVEYDTILVNLMADEYKLNFVNELKSNGFIVTTSGSPNDFNFLSRQKSIMSLADHSISFAVSTHVGYFLHMSISHEIVNINDSPYPDLTNLTSIHGRHLSLLEEYPETTPVSKFLDDNYSICLENEVEILMTFFKSGNNITDEQIVLFRKYWGGTEEIKSPSEIRKILL